MQKRESRVGPWLVMAYTALWAVVLVSLQTGIMFGVIGVLAQQGHPKPLQGVLEVVNTMPSWLLLSMLGVQFPGMLFTAWVVRGLAARWYGRSKGPGWTRVPWSELVAAHAPHKAAWALAVAVGLTVGWFPGLVANRIREAMPGSGSGVEAVGEIMSSGAAWERISLAFLVVIVAPVVEEFVFRGVLWDWLTRRFDASGRTALVVTSLLFAAYHLDPAQSTGLLFTAFVFGSVRWATGSVWPGVLAHLINNALGVTLGVMGAEALPEAPLVLTAATVASLAVAGLVHLQPQIVVGRSEAAAA